MLLSKGQTRHLVLLNPSSQELQIEQEEGSELTVHIIVVGGEDVSMQVYVNQLGEGAQTRLYGLVVAGGEQKVDLSTSLVHVKGGGKSEQLFKYVLSDKAQASFAGWLKVAQDAQKTDAYQTNRNIILSDDARMRTMPQLEIYADDVHCSHGASTGQLDDTALFYMQQRGISREHAQRLLLEAFAAEVVNTIDDEQVRENVRREVEETLYKFI